MDLLLNQLRFLTEGVNGQPFLSEKPVPNSYKETNISRRWSNINIKELQYSDKLRNISVDLEELYKVNQQQKQDLKKKEIKIKRPIFFDLAEHSLRMNRIDMRYL